MSLPLTCRSSSEAAGLCNLHRDIFALQDRVLIFRCDEFRDHLAIAVRDLRLGTRAADLYAVPDGFVEFLRQGPAPLNKIRGFDQSGQVDRPRQSRHIFGGRGLEIQRAYPV